MSGDSNYNKVRNEEFKIWKKSVPSLYYYICTKKPVFSSTHGSGSKVKDEQGVKNGVCFGSKVSTDASRGISHSNVLFSQRSDVFEIDFEIPMGSHSESDEALSEPKYSSEDEVMKQELQSNWTFLGENIAKSQYLDDTNDTVLAIASAGSLAWFKRGIKVPVQTLQEVIGPGTSFSAIHTNTDKKIQINDFCVSSDRSSIIKTQNTITNGSLIKIVDNASRPGAIIKTIKVSHSIATEVVRIIDPNCFVSCSDDSVVRFWDSRSGEKPLFTLTDDASGVFTALEVSPFLETVFATGSDMGEIKLWDIRSVIPSSSNKNPQELIKLNHPTAESVADFKFSYTNAEQFLSTGSNGGVYHWDINPITTQNVQMDESQESSDVDAVSESCLKFLHSGGNRNKQTVLNGTTTQNTLLRKDVANWHPLVPEFVVTVDYDSLLTVYKPFTGRDSLQENDNTEKEQQDI